MTSLTDKTCLECEQPFKGRADKKFCSDQCRVSHNNRLNSEANNYMKNVNNILRKNRRILSELNPRGKTKVPISRLHGMGFNFNYFTSALKTREGALYHYCYEQGYLDLGREQCLLVRKYVNPHH